MLSNESASQHTSKQERTLDQTTKIFANKNRSPTFFAPATPNLLAKLLKLIRRVLSFMNTCISWIFASLRSLQTHASQPFSFFHDSLTLSHLYLHVQTNPCEHYDPAIQGAAVQVWESRIGSPLQTGEIFQSRFSARCSKGIRDTARRRFPMAVGWKGT